MPTKYKTEPESVRDMWFAERQIGTVMLNYENSGDPIKVGNASCEYDRITCDWERENKVTVKHVIETIGEMVTSTMYRPKNQVTSSVDMTFDEFKDSEYYIPYIKRTAGCNFDSSFVDSFRFNAFLEDGWAEIDYKFPVIKTEPFFSGDCSGEIGYARVVVSDDGTVTLRLNSESIECDIERIIEAVKTLDDMEKRGVQIYGDELTVKLGEVE